MRHVIIEGPDGAGKTQLARELCDRYGFAYHHEGPPPTNVPALEHYARLLVEAKRATVFDRLHLGETVYGPILRGGSRISTRDLRLMNRLVTGTGTALVIALPPKETCLANSRRKGELLASEELRSIAYDCWRLLAYTKKLTHADHLVRFDYTLGLPFELPDLPRLPAGVIGSPTARVLLVGEQPNGTLDLPFFGAKHSSVFLDEALLEVGLPESDIALTNARRADGRVRGLSLMIKRMGVTRAVALGKVADRALTEQGVEHATVPHPQFWKRFHAKRRGDYVQLLKEAVC